MHNVVIDINVTWVNKGLTCPVITITQVDHAHTRLGSTQDVNNKVFENEEKCRKGEPHNIVKSSL